MGWLASGQQPVAAIVETDVKTGRRAARLTTRLLQGHVFFDQSVPAERFAGKTVTLSVWIKTQMKAGAGLQILDFVQSMHEVSGGEGHPGDGAWHHLTVTRTIRPDATGHVVFRLSAVVPYRKSPAASSDPEGASGDGR